MNIRHLKIFIMVANCNNMSLAADRLFISQPSVSQAIKEIEDYYEIKLFERLSKKLYITENGKLLLKYARHIVSSFEDMEKELKNSSEKISLTIGATITVGTCMINDILTKIKNKNSKIDVKVVINNSSDIEKLILESNLDIGILEGKINNKDIIKTPIYRDELILVAGKTNKFYKREYIEIKELEGQNLILREEGSGSREIFDNVLKENNIHINEKMTSTDTEAIKNLVIEGHGLAVLSKLIVKKELERGTLKAISIKNVDLYRDIIIAYHKNKFISEHLKLLIDILNN